MKAKALARAADRPLFEIIHRDTSSPDTPAGLKGMAQGGVMGAIGAVMNAVDDALAQVGAGLTAQPASAPRLWQALRRVGAA
ncbi:MAG: hypothetical protein ACREFA_08900 [Stellaceae bacterium]